MIVYFIKSAICLLLLLAFYQLFLEREKMHQFNRYYLLGSVLFSFLVPLYTIYIEVNSLVFEATPILNTITEFENTPEVITITTPIDYSSILIGLYVFISAILLIRFGKNLFKIVQKIKKNTQIPYQKATLILVKDNILPHTFLHYIFINKKEYENDSIETELFTHELTHVTQKHTIDVLLIELLQIVFWINPIFLFLKKAIKLNHEFLADTTVIASHKNISEYQSLLVNKAAWNNTYYLASNLNYSLTKKRLLMMTTQKSRRKILLKKLAIFPLLAGFVFLFANRVEAQEKIISIEDEKPVKVFKDKKEEQLYKEYVYKDTYIIIDKKNGAKVTKPYKELTEKEKKSFKSFLPPLKTKKKTPTKTQFSNWKDNTKYAVWIDGKSVKNSILSNYKTADFSNFSDSFVHKNARSKRFSQTHQVHLSTNLYFKKKNIENVNDFKKYKKEYSIKKGVSEKTKDVNKLKLPYPIQEKGATKKQLTTYNTLAKKYNKIPKKKRIYKLKDIQKLLSIYKVMTTEQKKKSAPFPESISPPPPSLKKGASKAEIEKIIKVESKDYSISNFNITIEKEKNRIKLTCNSGCAWKKLTFTLENNKQLAIDKFGITNMKSTSKSDFLFVIMNKGNQIGLKSIKGTAWKKLGFSIYKNEKKYLNQLGVSTLKKTLKNSKYFLDNKPVREEELEKLSPNKIAAVRVKNNKDGSKSIYITRHKK